MAVSIRRGNEIFNVYTDAEIVGAWGNPDAQGNRQARERGKWCVVRRCNYHEAIALSRCFIEEFAIPTCCHWNGSTLSMYCGDASHGAADLKERIEAINFGWPES